MSLPSLKRPAIGPIRGHLDYVASGEELADLGLPDCLHQVFKGAIEAAATTGRRGPLIRALRRHLLDLDDDVVATLHFLGDDAAATFRNLRQAERLHLSIR